MVGGILYCQCRAHALVVRREGRQTTITKFNISSSIITFSIIESVYSYRKFLNKRKDGPTMAEQYRSIDSCVPGPGVSLNIEKPLYPSCRCEDLCTAEECSCMIKCDAYDSSGSLKEEFMAVNGPAVYECSHACTCSEKCGNRQSQKGNFVGLKVASAGRKGVGVFTDRHLSKGTFVCEYVGEVVRLKHARDRLKQLSDDDMCYVLILREHLSSGAVLHTCIDASRYGNVARFINHSCAPNLTLIAVRTHSVFPRLCFFANHPISAGEELAFSYFGSPSGADCLALGDKPCDCGSGSKCMGFLPLDRTCA